MFSYDKRGRKETYVINFNNSVQKYIHFKLPTFNKDYDINVYLIRIMTSMYM